MLSLTSKIDTREVERSLAELERRGQNPTQAMRRIGKDMRADQKEHAAYREGPDGKWPARADSTVKAARKGRGRARRLMGRLPSAVKYTSQSRQVTAQSLVAWSGAHQEGATVGRGARLPARPFLWISDKLLETSIRVLQRYLVNGWGR